MYSYKSYRRKPQFQSSVDLRRGGIQDGRQYKYPNKPLPGLALRSPSRSILPPPPQASTTESDRISETKFIFATSYDTHSALKSINTSNLSKVVRRALNREYFQIQGWRVRSLDGGASNSSSLGLYRFEGVGQDRKEWFDWSVILKIIQDPASEGYSSDADSADLHHWNYWKREMLLYQSGWLETLPEGIAAPHCYETVEISDNVAGLWLEDINDTYTGAWPLHRYALAARHLGRLNGTYSSRRPLPTFPWMSINRNRQWLDFIPWRTTSWKDSRVLHQFPRPRFDSFINMLEDNELFLQKLNQLPKTVCHGDTYPTNFKSRHWKGGQEQTVAMDWALMGLEPLGDDLGQLVYGAHLNLKGYRLQDIDQTLFTSYINGLQDSTCRVDPHLVRFAYVTSAALRVGLYKLVILGEELKKEDGNGYHAVNSSMFSDPFEAVMADEAYRLLDAI
jgi:hypothetical protein